ncbi:efflux RND transporter periplasmic adaptor subunit [bacterium]|nr:efflux RND transporter periplasmic adaptor subunit [bacterium]MBU1884744.1 efflux RND transporter periplasmic adaptor subunit [bacterium]
MNKAVKIAIGVAAAVAIIVAGVKTIKNAKQKDAASPQAVIYPIVVSKMSPKMVDAKLTLPYLAEVSNDKDVKLSSRIAARIISIKSSGLHVSKGDIIARLDTTEIGSNLASVNEQLKAANVSLENLQATHQRTSDLLKMQGASIEESQKELSSIANIEAQIASLKQKAIELNNSLSYATITSPVDGVITKTFDNEGAVSMPGKALINISAKNGFYLMVRVPSDLKIKGVVFNSKTYETLPLGSTSAGLAEYKVYVGADNLTSGDRIEVDVVVFDDKGTLLPFDALLNRDGKSYVLIIKGSQADAQEVHILQSAQQGVVIKESLEGKDIVVAKPDILLRLVSGYALKVKE